MKCQRYVAVFLLFCFMFVVESAPQTIAEPAAKHGAVKTLDKLVLQLQAKPDNKLLRERILRLAARMKDKSPIPEEARRHLVYAETALKSASTDEDIDRAIEECRQSIAAAPWWGTAYASTASALQKRKRYDDAIDLLRYALLAGPPAAAVRELKDRIYALQEMKDEATRAKVREQEEAVASAEAERKHAEEEKRKQQEEAVRKMKEEGTAARTRVLDSFVGDWDEKISVIGGKEGGPVLTGKFSFVKKDDGTIEGYQNEIVLTSTKRNLLMPALFGVVGLAFAGKKKVTQDANTHALNLRASFSDPQSTNLHWLAFEPGADKETSAFFRKAFGLQIGENSCPLRNGLATAVTISPDGHQLSFVYSSSDLAACGSPKQRVSGDIQYVLTSESKAVWFPPAASTPSANVNNSIDATPSSAMPSNTPSSSGSGDSTEAHYASGFYDPARGSFDVLDGAIVDPTKGKLTLFGHSAADGAPRPVPYLDYLAAALDSRNPTFSLEWTPESRQSIDRAFNMPDLQLTDNLAHVFENDQLTKTGAWWFRMLGANVQEGMDKMSFWNAVLPVAGYPDAGKVMKVVDEVERAANAGTANQEVMDEDGNKRSPFMHLFNATAPLVLSDTMAYLNAVAGFANGDADSRETLFAWVFRGIARAYKMDENRYLNEYQSLQQGGTDWSMAFEKTLNMSQDDTVQVQKDAFHSLVGSRAFIHVPPDVMRDVLGVSPVVVPVYDGLSANSLLAKVAFDADVFGKNLMDMPEIKSDIAGYRTYFEWRQTVSNAPATEGHTWFAADGFELSESADGKSVRFGKTPVRLHMEKYGPEASGKFESRFPALRDNGTLLLLARESIEDPSLKQYADELTALYDPLAAKFPVLLDLRESMKVMAIADWLKQKGIKVVLPAPGRGSWEPPAQVPGVVHMEIAVQNSPVGEVMSASGGIDFRVDQNWNLIKQSIEEQPGPPPAHGVIIGFNPNTGGVSDVKDVAGNFAQSGTSASSAGVDRNGGSASRPELKDCHEERDFFGSSKVVCGSNNPNAIQEVASAPSSPEPVKLEGNTPALLREPDPPMKATPPQPLPSCSETLNALHHEAEVVQKTLEGLNHAMAGNQESRRESMDTVKEIEDSAWEKLPGALLGASIHFTHDIFDRRLEEANGELRDAVTKRTSPEMTPDQRKQYDAAFKILSGQRDEIVKVIGKFEWIETSNATREVDNRMRGNDKDSVWEKRYENFLAFINDPHVQKIFHVSQGAAKAFDYVSVTKDMLDNWYDAARQYVAWKQLNRLNDQSAAYLQSVNRFSRKLTQIEKRIHAIEVEMQNSSNGAPCGGL